MPLDRMVIAPERGLLPPEVSPTLLGEELGLLKSWRLLTGNIPVPFSGESLDIKLRFNG